MPHEVKIEEVKIEETDSSYFRCVNCTQYIRKDLLLLHLNNIHIDQGDIVSKEILEIAQIHSTIYLSIIAGYTWPVSGSRLI